MSMTDACVGPFLLPAPEGPGSDEVIETAWLIISIVVLALCLPTVIVDSLTDFLRQASVPIPEIRRFSRSARHSISRIALTPAQLVEALGL